MQRNYNHFNTGCVYVLYFKSFFNVLFPVYNFFLILDFDSSPVFKWQWVLYENREPNLGNWNHIGG